MNHEDSTPTTPGPRPAFHRRVTETAVWTYSAEAVVHCAPLVRWEGPNGGELDTHFATSAEVLGRFYDDICAGRPTGVHVIVRHCDARGADCEVGLHFTVQTVEASPADQPGIVAVSGLSHEHNGRITRVLFDGDAIISVSNEIPVMSPPPRTS